MIMTVAVKSSYPVFRSIGSKNVEKANFTLAECCDYPIVAYCCPIVAIRIRII